MHDARLATPRSGRSSGEARTVPELVAGLGSRGEQPALIAFTRDGVDERSFESLARDAERVAAGLAARGVEPGDRVAVYADNGPRWILACLGALRRGAVAMPVDAQLDDRNLAHVLNDGAPRLICTSGKLAGRVAEVLDEPPVRIALDDDDDESGWPSLVSQADDAPGAPTGPDAPTMLFYTSGTTGAPKGVPLDSANLLFQLRLVAESGILGDGDRLLLPLPLHHVYPMVMGLLAPLALGLPVILPRSLTGPQVVRALGEGRASVVIGVPRLYESLADSVDRQARGAGVLAHTGYRAALAVSRGVLRLTGRQVGRRLLAPVHRRVGPELRVLASGGSPLDPALARQLCEFGWQVAVGYGLTETAPLLTLNLPGDFDPDTVGRPVRDTEVRVDRRAAPAHGEDEDENDSGAALDPTAEPGVEGEIVARGPGVFAGYRGLPEATREVLVDGWFRTGDLGRFDRAGRLTILGRRSTLLVTPGGENVQPDAVEEALEAHPALREAGVLQDDGELVALLVPEPEALRGADREPREVVRDALQDAGSNLPSYQRPSDFAVTREALPRTRLGKIRRAELVERYAAAQASEGEPARQAPVPVDEMSGADRALLDDPAARAVWDWLAERYPDSGLSPDTSPDLDLGVDSMDWVDLTLEISARAGVEVDEEAIAGVETVRDLLEAVADAGRGGGEGLDLGEDPLARLDAEQRRWLEPPGSVGSAVGRGLHAVGRGLMTVFRLRVEGSERLPAPDTPVVFTPNHVSFLDPFAVGAALPWARLCVTHWGGYVGAAFSNPLTRAFSRVTRTFPVDPNRGMVSALALGAAALQRGDSLVWFPEGQRSHDGRLRPFKPGLGIVLESQPVTVVPVHLAGTREALPPGSGLPRPGRRIRVRFGEPVAVATLDEEGDGERRRERLMDALRRRLEALGAAR